jgi:hypothetical protein
MNYLILNDIDSILIKSRKTNLNAAIEKAVELIEDGISQKLIICKEIEDKKKPACWNRIFICEIV